MANIIGAIATSHTPTIGFAYDQNNGPWTDAGFLEHVRHTFGDDWGYALTTLAKYDKSNLFSSPFLDQLFQPA